MTRPLGRPSLYSEEMVQKATEYLNSCVDQEVEREGRGEGTIVYKVKAKIPTRGGMARALGVSRDTLYEWASVHPDFSYIMEELGAEQEERLINGGLTGDYNSTIAKVLLTKHGYREGKDITSDDKQLNGAALLDSIVDESETGDDTEV